MARVVYGAVLALVAAQALLVGQAPDVGKILADVRAALGGEDKLAAVKTLTVEGKTARVGPDGSARSTPFDMAFELPGKFARKDVLGNLNGAEITRTAGFNGEGLVEQMEMPQMGGGGGMVFTRAPGGGPAMQIGGRGTDQSPDQVAAVRRATLLNNKRDFTRLTLGMFATSFPVYPVEFAYAGTAESPDGKAYVLDVKGTDDFAVKLFIDTKTNLPLMLSWMDKEPLRMTSSTRSGGPGGTTTSSGGGVQTMTFGGPGGGRGMSPEEMAKMREDMDRQLKEAEANRKVVEYRMFYGEYKAFDGVRLPTKIQRMIDGNPTEELEFERVRVNGRVDQKKFEVVK